jgi:hypothetical protein
MVNNHLIAEVPWRPYPNYYKNLEDSRDRRLMIALVEWQS